jgi:uncharacterized protein (TIGR03435 family)
MRSVPRQAVPLTSRAMTSRAVGPVRRPGRGFAAIVVAPIAVAAFAAGAGMVVGLSAQTTFQATFETTLETTSPEPDALVFDVASVKQSTGCPPKCGLIRPTIGTQGYHAEGATLRSLMTIAYSVTDRQISGGASWIGSDRFDIEAKAERQHKTDELHVMLQHLLEERFSLKVRHEMREEAAWALEIAKSGSKMAVHDAGDKDYAPMGLQGVAGDEGFCFALAGRNVSMPYLAFTLSRNMSRTVVDKTGLAGHYDFRLQFVPDGLNANGADGKPLTISPDCQDVFSALPKQLGLQLEATRAPVEHLVIEHAEKPTEN